MHVRRGGSLLALRRRFFTTKTRVLDRPSRHADVDPRARAVHPLGAHRRRRGPVPLHVRTMPTLVRVRRGDDRGVPPRARVRRLAVVFRVDVGRGVRVL